MIYKENFTYNFNTADINETINLEKGSKDRTSIAYIKNNFKNFKGIQNFKKVEVKTINYISNLSNDDSNNIENLSIDIINHYSKNKHIINHNILNKNNEELLEELFFATIYNNSALDSINKKSKRVEVYLTKHELTHLNNAIKIRQLYEYNKLDYKKKLKLSLCKNMKYTEGELKARGIIEKKYGVYRDILNEMSSSLKLISEKHEVNLFSSGLYNYLIKDKTSNINKDSKDMIKFNFTISLTVYEEIQRIKETSKNNEGKYDLSDAKIIKLYLLFYTHWQHQCENSFIYITFKGKEVGNILKWQVLRSDSII